MEQSQDSGFGSMDNSDLQIFDDLDMVIDKYPTHVPSEHEQGDIEQEVDSLMNAFVSIFFGGFLTLAFLTIKALLSLIPKLKTP